MQQKAILLFCTFMLLGCSPGESNNPWVFSIDKDRITDVQTFRAKNVSFDKKAMLWMYCSPGKKLNYAFHTSTWFGSTDGATVTMRVGKKDSISSTRWLAFDKLVGPQLDNHASMKDFADYIGTEQAVLVRIQGKRASADLDFNLSGLSDVLAKQEKLCTP
jgi:hypothetical protein